MVHQSYMTLDNNPWRYSTKISPICPVKDKPNRSYEKVIYCAWELEKFNNSNERVRVKVFLGKQFRDEKKGKAGKLLFLELDEKE